MTIDDSDAHDLRVVFDINTTGQHVIESERDFWTAELAGFQAVVEGRQPPSMAAAEKPFEGPSCCSSSAIGCGN